MNVLSATHLITRLVGRRMVNWRMVHRGGAFFFAGMIFAVAKHDLGSLRGCVGGGNLRVAVVGSDQLVVRLGLELEAGNDDLELGIGQRLLQVDNEVSHLGVLGILRYRDLDGVRIGGNDHSRHLGFLVLQQGPELVGIFLGADGQNRFLVGEGQRIQIGRGGNQIVNLLGRDSWRGRY